MTKRAHTPEQIVQKLREAEVEPAKGRFAPWFRPIRRAVTPGVELCGQSKPYGASRVTAEPPS
jgi:hypothetical protein